jgi:fumarylacetoacetase
LLELTWNGEFGRPVPGNQRTPLQLPSGEQRTFLADGDEVTFRGWCERPGARRIGLGECRGVILGAI